MSVSTSDRRHNFLDTLSTMVAAVCDKAVIDLAFTPGRDPVDRALPTTWDEFLRRGWTDSVGSFAEDRYSLTPDGWACGVLMDKPANLDERCGRLAATLKEIVKGRQHDELTILKDIVEASVLPEGWVWNAVQGNLLGRRFPNRGLHLKGFEDGIACHLWVPRTFGLEQI